MKLAVCNELFEGWPLEKAFKAIAESGYSGVEIAPFTLTDSSFNLSASQRAYIRKTAEDYGLRIIGFHWLLARTEGLHITHPEISVRSATSNYLVKLAECCADLGGHTMVFGSPKQRNVLPGVSQSQAWNYAKDTFLLTAERIQKYNVTLCIEPLGPEETNFINTAEDAIRLLKEVNHPNFKMVLDVKAMSTESRPISDIIESSAGYFVHFHANDANRRGPGFGKTDFAPITASLKKIGYDGWISVEVFDFSPDPQTVAAKSADYLRKFFINDSSR